jgi:hypothetical protein
MAKLRFRGRRSQSGGMLALVALGAVAGMALGVVLAERTGGVEGLKRRLRDAKRHRLPPGDDGYDDPGTRPPDYSEAYAEEYDDFFDDDDAFIDDEESYDDDNSAEAELESRVLEAFRNDPILREQAIDIGAIGDGLIELTGWVHSAEEVAHALTLARGVPDVAHVVDRLAIREIEAPRVGKHPEDR